METGLSYDKSVMLGGLRKYGQTWIIRILLGGIAFFLTFWGIGTGFFSQVRPVASVNGVRILPNQIESEAETIRRNIQSVYGANAPAVLKSENIRAAALDQIIENQLVGEEARHLGIEVSDAALEQRIESERAFQRDGQFDLAIYEDAVRSAGMLPNEYEAGLRTSMVEQTLREMVEQGVQVSGDEARHAYDLRNQKITLRYIELPYSGFTAGVSPTAQQIAAYYKAHAEDFREPERAQIQFIHYDPLALAAKFAPADKEINDYYNRNLKSRFTHSDEVSARHILLSVPEGATEEEKSAAKAKAEDVLKQLKSGGDFIKLAARYSEDPSTRPKGGELGSFGRGQMIKPFEDAVFRMKPGEIGIVETRFGYHVVRVDGFTPAHTDTLAQARPKIVDALRTEAGTKLARDAIDQDVSAALSGESLGEIAEKRGLEVAEPRPFAPGEQLAGAPSDTKLAQAAFSLEAGQVRAVPEAGAPYLLKVIARTPSHIPLLNEIESKVRDALIRASAESDARAAAQKLLSQIKSPADFDKVAAAGKLEVHTTDPFTRSTNSVAGIGEFPEVTEACALVPAIPGVIDRVMEQSANSYIFEVIARSAPSDQDWKGAEQSFTDEYLAQRRAEAWARFIDQLKSDAEIVIHNDQLGETSSM